jgi:hypothetical protein
MADRAVISLNVPNILTIWLMLALGLFLFAIVSQLAMRHPASPLAKSNTTGVGGGDDGTG